MENGTAPATIRRSHKKKPEGSVVSRHERNARILELWSQGKSAWVIASEIGEGLSRNAVCGFIFRERDKGNPLAQGRTSSETRDGRIKGRDYVVKPPREPKPIGRPRKVRPEPAPRKPIEVAKVVPITINWNTATAARKEQPVSPKAVGQAVMKTIQRWFVDPATIGHPTFEEVLDDRFACRAFVGHQKGLKGHVCGKRTKLGRPWCQEHYDQFYRPVRQRHVA